MESLIFLLTAVAGIHDLSNEIQNGLFNYCENYVLVEGFCYEVCPDSYKTLEDFCEPFNYTIFSYDFSSNHEVLPLFNDQKLLISDSLYSAPLIQTSQRGLFFKTQSANCITKNNFVFGPKLMIVL